ncbi:hypothetical protein F4677DRAFT_31811 [Hypoxylon crocopeplum]|nr:hypothetical protein F4677DRAFT_31811 [Hypoxylon crocopeplum]
MSTSPTTSAEIALDRLLSGIVKLQAKPEADLLCFYTRLFRSIQWPMHPATLCAELPYMRKRFVLFRALPRLEQLNYVKDFGAVHRAMQRSAIPTPADLSTLHASGRGGGIADPTDAADRMKYVLYLLPSLAHYVHVTRHPGVYSRHRDGPWFLWWAGECARRAAAGHSDPTRNVEGERNLLDVLTRWETTRRLEVGAMLPLRFQRREWEQEQERHRRQQRMLLQHQELQRLRHQQQQQQRQEQEQEQHQQQQQQQPQPRGVKRKHEGSELEG